MRISKKWNWSLGLITLAICFLYAPLWSQNVSSALQGTVIDSTNAVVIDAQIKLLNQETTAERTTASNSSGLFRFPNLLPGVYTLVIEAKGFQSYTQKEIRMVGSETRDLGNIKLVIGSTNEQVTVTADVTPIQLASSEKASTIDTMAIDNTAIHGRDMVSFLDLIPGIKDVPDTNTGAAATRNVASSQALMGVTINGNDVKTLNFTVDGIPALNVNSSYVQFEPNIDSIEEVKVSTSNYQAEFGRSSGGTITVITKGGTNQFHGSGWFTHKHEQFNANSYFNNKSNIAKNLYRFNIQGWSLGGPLYIPNKLNSKKIRYSFLLRKNILVN